MYYCQKEIIDNKKSWNVYANTTDGHHYIGQSDNVNVAAEVVSWLNGGDKPRLEVLRDFIFWE